MVTVGRLQLIHFGAMDYNAIIVVVVGLTFGYLLVLSLWLQFWLALVVSYPGLTCPCLCLDAIVFCFLQLCHVTSLGSSVSCGLVLYSNYKVGVHGLIFVVDHLLFVCSLDDFCLVCLLI